MVGWAADLATLAAKAKAAFFFHRCFFLLAAIPEKHVEPGDGGNGEIGVSATLGNTVTLAGELAPVPPGHW